MPELVTEPTKAEELRSLTSFPDGVSMYLYASSYVEQYRKTEFDECWTTMAAAAQSPITPHKFLREYLWCVYVAGFSAKTIASYYPKLLVAHQIENEAGEYQEPLPWNVLEFEDAIQPVIDLFANRAKATAIQKTRGMIMMDGWPKFHDDWLAQRDPLTIQGLPYMGPALSKHLARNLGNLGVVKPDVHLNRLALKYSYANAEDMCKKLSNEPPGKTDLLLWLASRDNGTT